MSNIVHKVKDAISDRDKPVTRSQAGDNRHRSAGNPFTPSYNTGQNASGMNKPTNMNPNANQPEFANYSSGGVPDTKTQSTCSIESELFDFVLAILYSCSNYV